MDFFVVLPFGPLETVVNDNPVSFWANLLRDSIMSHESKWRIVHAYAPI